MCEVVNKCFAGRIEFSAWLLMHGAWQHEARLCVLIIPRRNIFGDDV